MTRLHLLVLVALCAAGCGVRRCESPEASACRTACVPHAHCVFSLGADGVIGSAPDGQIYWIVCNGPVLLTTSTHILSPSEIGQLQDHAEGLP